MPTCMYICTELRQQQGLISSREVVLRRVALKVDLSPLS